jgi:ribonuclease P protein component
MSTIPRLKRRSDFLRVAACQRKVVMPTMIVQLAEHSQTNRGGHGSSLLRVGFTASRKVGNSVKRNRARRRLRAVVQIVCPSVMFSGEDVVLIARRAAVEVPFTTLLRDFHQALNRLELPSL